jgi:hypothetical protein
VKETSGARADAALLRVLLAIDPGARSFLARLHKALETVGVRQGGLTGDQADIDEDLGVVLVRGAGEEPISQEHRDRAALLADLLIDLLDPPAI